MVVSGLLVILGAVASGCGDDSYIENCAEDNDMYVFCLAAEGCCGNPACNHPESSTACQNIAGRTCVFVDSINSYAFHCENGRVVETPWPEDMKSDGSLDGPSTSD